MLLFGLVFAEKSYTIFIWLGALKRGTHVQWCLETKRNIRNVLASFKPEALNYRNFCDVLFRILNKLQSTVDVISLQKYSDLSFVTLWSFTCWSSSVLTHSYCSALVHEFSSNKIFLCFPDQRELSHFLGHDTVIAQKRTITCGRGWLAFTLRMISWLSQAIFYSFDLTKLTNKNSSSDSQNRRVNGPSFSTWLRYARRSLACIPLAYYRDSPTLFPGM